MHHRSFNGMTKWMVGAFFSGIITVMGFLLVLDRARIAADATAALHKAVENDKQIAVMQTTLGTIEERLKSIEKDQKAILEAVQ
jgi:hypothetical protein